MKRFYICEKEWICDNGTKTVQNHPMQHKHKYMFNGTKIHAVTWSENLKDGMLYTIHSKGVQLISDNNPVHSVFVFLL